MIVRMIVDAAIPTVLIPMCLGITDGATADAYGDQTLGAFDGSELAARLFGFDSQLSVAAIIANLGQVKVADALGGRGLLLLTPAGRLGITIGYGRVVEPVGRQYCMLTPDPSRYQGAFDTGKVLYTCGSPI